MAARKPTPAELLSLIADRAEALRKAGVLVVQVDGFSAQLAPWSEAGPGAPAGPAQVDHSDPLSDPSTYANGRVPGFERPEGETS